MAIECSHLMVLVMHEPSMDHKNIYWPQCRCLMQARLIGYNFYAGIS